MKLTNPLNMYLQGKYITDITPEDIEELFNNNIRESKNLDYKREIGFDDKENKKLNFIIDVMAMYNSDGGCIIYGIQEKKDSKNDNTGYPDQLINVEYSNKDNFERQIHAIIKDNTDPSITNIVTHFITVEDKNILIIGIPRGLGLPSMITYRDLNRFHRRNASGNYAVSTFELNQMFLQNQTVKEKALNFRASRIKDIKDKSVYPDMEVKGDLFLHLIPFSFLEDKMYDLQQILQVNPAQKIFPVNKGDYYSQNKFEYNLDGLLTYNIRPQQKNLTSYIQYFRNGIIEIYTNACLEENESSSSKYIRLSTAVQTTLFSIANMILVYKQLEIELPFLVSLSLLGVQDCTFLVPPSTVAGQVIKPDIHLPSILINTYDFTYPELFIMLKSTFNILWQGVNIPECPPVEEFIKFSTQ